MATKGQRVYDKGYEDHRRGGRNRSPDSPPRKKDEKKARNALSTGLNDYFIDGEGIHRDVLQRNIAFMLGNQATSRPETYNGVKGYMIKAIRPFTNDQLDDLVEISSQYREERSRFEKSQGQKYNGRGEPPTLPYPESKTFQNFPPRGQDSRPPFMEEAPYQPGPYANPSQRDPYGGNPGQYMSASNTAYYNPGNYSPGPPVTSGPPYQAPLHSNSRPIMNEPPVGFGRPERPVDRDPYLPGPQYGQLPPREYVDTRTPRYLPQDLNRGSRAPQSMYTQSQYNTDVLMQDPYEPGYGAMDMDPGRPSQRAPTGFSTQPMRTPADHYDDRISPDQGPYKMSHPEEERRHRDEFDRRRQ